MAGRFRSGEIRRIDRTAPGATTLMTVTIPPSVKFAYGEPIRDKGHREHDEVGRLTADVMPVTNAIESLNASVRKERRACASGSNERDVMLSR